MASAGQTDFEEYGLSRGPYPVAGRLLLLTVDFEAFAPEVLPLWVDAMHHWATCAERTGLRFSFFLSVEDAVRILATAGDAPRRFLGAMRRLDEAGSLFYAHNHFVFDPETGQKKPLAQEPGDLPRGYGKRKSLFFDAVHRHRLRLAAWLTTVREVHEKVLSDAGCRRPAVQAFRAGGWDYGSTPQETELYLDSLASAGFAIDSSACRGTFGTATWRVGADFGRNVFRLTHGLLEVAPTWAMDMSGSPTSAAAVGNLLRLGVQAQLWTGRSGACVVVLHFDHLFRPRPHGSLERLDHREPASVSGRIERWFRVLVLLQSILRLRCATFEDLDATAWPGRLAEEGRGLGVREGSGPGESRRGQPDDRRTTGQDSAATSGRFGS